MPIGSYAAQPLLAQTLIERGPKMVLDLGLGFGGCGVVVREWLDLGVRPWKTYLAGVECWAEYRNPAWDLYDVVYVQTIESFLPTCSERFDCVILGDVLEHFEKAAGRAVLEDVKRLVAPRGVFIVVTPAQYFAQEAAHGNEHERHCSYWSQEDLESAGFQVARAGRPEWFCGECWYAIWRR